jgi:hypothetical protein
MGVGAVPSPEQQASSHAATYAALDAVRRGDRCGDRCRVVTAAGS